MIDLRVKGDQTKKRLIDACERLIAEKGFEGVSVRDITGMAKANVAAVNYHFGSREGLLDAVLSHRVRPLMEKRMELLTGLAAKATLRELFSVWSSPLLEMEPAAGNDEVQHACLLGRCLEKLLSGKNESLNTLFVESEKLLTEAIIRALGACEPADVAWRLHFCHAALVGGLIYGANLLHPFHRRDVIEKWLDSCVAQWGVSDRSKTRVSSNRVKAVEHAEKEQAPIAEVVSEVMSGLDEPVVMLPEEPVVEIPEEEETIPASPAWLDEPVVEAQVEDPIEEPIEAPPAPILQEEVVPSPVMATAPKAKKRKPEADTGELFLF